MFCCVFSAAQTALLLSTDRICDVITGSGAADVVSTLLRRIAAVTDHVPGTPTDRRSPGPDTSTRVARHEFGRQYAGVIADL